MSVKALLLVYALGHLASILGYYYFPKIDNNTIKCEKDSQQKEVPVPTERSPVHYFIPDDIIYLQENETLELKLEITVSFEMLNDSFFWCLIHRPDGRLNRRIDHSPADIRGYNFCQICYPLVRSMNHRNSSQNFSVLFIDCVSNNTLPLEMIEKYVDNQFAAAEERRKIDNTSFIFPRTCTLPLSQVRQQESSEDFDKAWDIFQNRSLFPYFNDSRLLSFTLLLRADVTLSGTYAIFAGLAAKAHCVSNPNGCIKQQYLNTWIVGTEERVFLCREKQPQEYLYCSYLTFLDIYLRKSRLTGDVSDTNYVYYSSKLVKGLFNQGQSELSITFNQDTQRILLSSSVSLLWSVSRANSSQVCVLQIILVINSGTTTEKQFKGTVSRDVDEFVRRASKGLYDIVQIKYSFEMSVYEFTQIDFHHSKMHVPLCQFCTNESIKCVKDHQQVDISVKGLVQLVDELSKEKDKLAYAVKLHSKLEDFCQYGLRHFDKVKNALLDLRRECLNTFGFACCVSMTTVVMIMMVTYLTVKRINFEKEVQKAKSKSELFMMLRSRLKTINERVPLPFSSNTSMYVSFSHKDRKMFASQILPKLKASLPSRKVFSNACSRLGKSKIENVAGMISSCDTVIVLLSETYAKDPFLVWEFGMIVTASCEQRRRLVVCRSDEYFAGVDFGLYGVHLFVKDKRSLNERLEELVRKVRA